MNMFDLGRWMIKRRMQAAKVASLDKLLTDFKELDGKIIACEMTMEVVGIRKD